MNEISELDIVLFKHRDIPENIMTVFIACLLTVGRPPSPAHLSAGPDFMMITDHIRTRDWKTKVQKFLSAHLPLYVPNGIGFYLRWYLSWLNAQKKGEQYEDVPQQQQSTATKG